AQADQDLVELERKARADADLERRKNVWEHRRFATDAAEFKFLGAEAHNVFFEANVTLEVERKKVDVLSPMYKGDRVVIVAQDPDAWNRRVTVSWAESDGLGVERLSKLFVV
ncbi:HPr family phosphocarrier protein, partial [Glycomyces rutgersensis]